MTIPQPHIKRKDPRRSLDQVLKKLATLRSSMTGTSLFAEENESAIDPGSRFIKIWHHVLLGCVLLQAFLVPYFIVFDPNAPIEMPVEVYVYLVCDFAFLLDFVVQAHTGYYDDGNLIRDVNKTRRRYLKSRAFLFDLVVIVPLSLLRIDLGSVPHAILEVHKVLRFLKIPRYIASLDDMYAKQFVAMKLLKMVVATVYLSHVVACLRFAFGYDLHHDNHWLPKVPSRRANSRGRYVMSLFWAFGLLSGFFEGELPHRIPEFVFGIFVAMCGFSLFTTLCATFFMISKCESGDSEAAEARINQLRHSLSFHRVPDDLQRKAIDYLRRYYTDVESNDREVMKLLCSSITKDIQIELLRDTVGRIPIFVGCRNEFITAVTGLLELISVAAQTTVFSAGGFGDSMYIVHSGVLNVIVNGVAVREMRKGMCFGELSVFSNTPRSATIVSATYSTLYKLSRFHCERLLEGYPDCASRISSTVSELLNRTFEPRTSSARSEASESRELRSKREARGSVLIHLWQTVASIRGFSQWKQRAYIYPGMDSDNKSTGISNRNDDVSSIATDDRMRDFYDKTSSQAQKNHVEAHWIARRFLLRECIDADSPIRMIWIYALQAVLVYNWLVIPLDLCFPAFNRPLRYIKAANAVADTVLYVDIYLNLNLSFTLNSEKITDPSRSSIQYLRGSFAFDLLCAFPYSIFDSSTTNARLPRLLRATKLAGHYAEVDRFFHFTNRRRLVVLGLILVMLYHAVACLYFGITNIEGFSPLEEAWLPTNDVYLKKLNNTHYEDINRTICLAEDHAVRKIAFTEYCRALYYAANVLTGLGKTIEPDSNVQYVAALFFMISGFLITGIVVDNVQKRFTASAYEHKQFYATRTRIQLFLRRQKAPIAIFQRVNSFLDFWWSCHRGAFINQLLADLPVSMRRDILKSIAGPAFQSLALLQGVRPVLEALEDFLVANMKFILYGQGEVVYRQGDYATGIFFLLEGEVCIITNAQNPRGIPLGSFFGTATLHHSESAEGYGEHVSATTGCILLFVSKDHLRAMEEIFPPIATELLHLESRLLRNKLAKTDVNNGGDRRSTIASLSRSSGLNVLANKSVVDAFDPDSPYVIMWETWLFIAMTVQWMTTVFQICFRMKKVRYIQGDIISLVLEASFVADVYIRSRLGYHAYGNKIMDLHVVRRTYFRSRTFVIDAVSLLPLNVVNFLRSPEQRLDILNINKLLRLFKVPSQLHALENRYLKCTTELRLFKLVYYTLLLSHMFGCMYFDFASNSSRIFTSGLTEVETEFGNDKWLPGKELESAPLNLQYFSSLFWSFGLMSASYQDELPKTIHESIYSVITMTSGFFLFAYVVGNFTDIIELVDGDNREFNEKLASVRLLLWHFKLPKSIEDRVTTFYCFRRYHTITQERHLERFLPPSLLTDIRLVHLKPMIAKVSFLSGMEGSVTRMLVSQFTQVLALRDEFICKHGEEGYDMFFVFTGFLDVLIPVDKADSSTGDAEKKRDGSTATVLDPDDTQCCLLMKVNTLSSGSYFGENGLFTKSLRNASIRASTSCILYKLSRESLELVFDRYPLWKEKVLRIATLQREQARLAHLSAEEQKRSSDEAGGSMLSRLDILNQRAERLEEEMRFVHIKRLESTKEVVKESRWRKIEWFHSVRSTVRRLSKAMLQGSEAQSRVHLIWLRVTILCTLYMCFVIPYRISIDPLMRSTFMATVIHILQLFCELFFIVDIFFNWNVHRGANAMELYEQSHRSMYVRERLFWDVVAALPIDHLLSDFVDNESLRLLRCAKIFNIIVYLGELSRRSVSYEINRFLSVCLLYTLAIYWCGCLYLAVSMKVGFGEEWQAWLPSKELEIEDTDDPSVKQVALRLLRGLFYGATAFLKKGRTFVPDRSSLYVFTIIVYFVGLLVMSFMLGEIVSLFISYIWNEVEFRKNHIAVELYLDRMKLSDGLKRRTHAFMSSLWSSHAGVHYQSIFEELPESIKSSCIKHIAQKPLRLFVSSIFRLLSVEGKDDLDLLTRSIAQSLKFEGYPRDEKVVTEGSISRAMYFVVKGCLSMESRSHSGIARVVIRKGDFFGDRGLLGCAVSAFTVNTVRACDLLSLSSESLLMAINAHTFSGMALLLAQRAHLRLVDKPLKLCSRKDMEDQWGNALIAELRRMQHKPSRTGSRRISILKPLGEVLTQEAKEYLDDLNGILTSGAEASRVFLSFLALVLPHDPLDGNAFSSLPVIGVTLEEPEESMDHLDGDTETKSHEPGPDTSTVPTTGSQDTTPGSDP